MKHEAGSTLELNAVLRIFGAPDHHAKLSSLPGFADAHHHRSGDPIAPSFEYTHDLWSLEAPDLSASLEEQCFALTRLVEPHVDALRAAIADAELADLCLGWLENNGSGGLVSVPPEAIGILRLLPIGVALNVTVGTAPSRRRLRVRKPRRGGRRR